MPRILSYFDKQKIDCLVNKISVYSLNTSKKKRFINRLYKPFLLSYISNRKLKNRVNELQKEPSCILQTLLPTEKSIQSGEFGEILCYYFVKDLYLPKILKGAQKLRWKIDKNKPLPFTDVILFYRGKANQTSGDDILISIESKAKATKKPKNQIREGIKGAEKDYTQRLAQTLDWFRDKAIQDGSDLVLGDYERFLDPSKHGTYSKCFKVFIVIDNALYSKEVQEIESFKELTSERNMDLKILIVKINDLKKTYENIFNKAIK